MTGPFDADIARDVREALRKAEADLQHFAARAQAGEVSVPLVHAVFRHMHNLKGSLRMLGAREASALIHEIETHFDAVRNGAPCPAPPVLERCLRAVSVIRAYLDGAAQVKQVEALTGALRTYRADAEEDAPAEHAATLDFPLAPDAAQRLRRARADGQPVYRVDKVVRTTLDRAAFEGLPIYEDLAAVGTHIATHPPFEHLPRHADETVIQILFAAQVPESELALRIFDPYRPLAEAPGGKAEGGHEADAPARAPMRVLIVEDDFVSRFTLREMLSGFGTCEVAVNGEEAVNAFQMRLEQGRPYDLVCLDIMMPKMDGHETIRCLRAMEAERGIHGLACTCVIMTTALNDVQNVMAAFSEQADAYLVKPIDFDALHTQLQKLDLLLPSLPVPR